MRQCGARLVSFPDPYQRLNRRAKNRCFSRPPILKCDKGAGDDRTNFIMSLIEARQTPTQVLVHEAAFGWHQHGGHHSCPSLPKGGVPTLHPTPARHSPIVNLF